MSRYKVALIALILLSIASVVGYSSFLTKSNAASSEKVHEVGGVEYLPNHAIITFNETQRELLSPTQSSISLNNTEIQIEKQLSNGSLLVEVPEGKSVEQFIEENSKNSLIERIQPNFKYKIDAIPTDDPQRGQLWGLDNTGQTVNGDPGISDADIDAPEAWAASGVLSEIIVAVIDTGIAYNHPDLDAALWDGTTCVDHDNVSIPGGCLHGYDFTGSYDNNPLSSGNDHGTHVAGTIAAESNNTTGIVGAAPNVKVMSLKSDLYTSEIVDAISFAENNGAKVINASWGANWTTCGALNDVAMYSAIAGFNGLFVTSAGNNAAEHDLSTFFGIPTDFGSTTSCWTALDNIISVAATTNNDTLAAFSDYGVNSVDIGAPGQTIFSTTISNASVEFEDFEAPTVPPAMPTGWTESGNSGTVNLGGAWTGTLMGDVSTFPYGDSSSYTSTTPTYDLSTYDSATIGFWLRCDTEYATNDDRLTMEFSDNGTVFGQPISWYEGFIDSDSDPSGYASDYIELNLPSSYLTANFKARYIWTSDGNSNNFEGCGVDDFEINGYYDSSTDDVYTYKNGTSMASPHVAAAAGFVWGVEPLMEYGPVKDALLVSGDQIAGLETELITGSRLNLYNAIGELVVVVPPPETMTTSEPNMVSFDGKLFQSIRNTNNRLLTRTKSSTSGAWTDWIDEGGSTLASPSIAVYNNVLFQSVRALDGTIYYRSKTSASGSWSSWETTGGLTLGTPTLVAFDGRLVQSVRALDNTIYLRSKSSVSGSWSGWTAEGGSTMENISMAVFNNVLFQSVRALDGTIYYRTKTSITASWSPWETTGGLTLGIPALAVFDGRLVQSVRALDSTLYSRSKSSVTGSWSSWTADGGSTLSGPAVATYNNTLFQSVRALDDTIYYRTKSSANGSWSSWSK